MASWVNCSWGRSFPILKLLQKNGGVFHTGHMSRYNPSTFSTVVSGTRFGEGRLRCRSNSGR